MSEIAELKSTYKSLANTVDTKGLSMLEIAEKCLVGSQEEKNNYTAVLILYCWPALEKLYFGQKTKIISLVDCYDIFMDAFLYVLEKQVWKDKNSNLYQDKDAILKAMYVTVESRRKNFFISQNRQKRVVNQLPLSLDYLTDEFQEGYFSPIVEKYNFNRGWERKYINSLWKDKLYITAIILHLILNYNVFEDECDIINVKKVKKYLAHFSIEQYLRFKSMYKINDLENSIYHKYIENIHSDYLYEYIRNALSSLRQDEKLKDIEYYVD